jgi:hypothetical protein
VKDKLQEHIIAEKQTTNKQAKMIGNENYEQKTSGFRKNIITIAIIQSNYLIIIIVSS